MTSPRKIQCSGCKAALTIDRPNERRTAPCPRCQHLIRIPDDLNAAADAATHEPRQEAIVPDAVPDHSAVQPAAQMAVASNGQTSGSSKWFLVTALLLLPAGYLAGASELNVSQGNTEPVVVEPTRASLVDDEKLRNRLTEFEVQEEKLKADERELLKELARIEALIMEELKISQRELSELRTISTGDET